MDIFTTSAIAASLSNPKRLTNKKGINLILRSIVLSCLWETVPKSTLEVTAIGCIEKLG